MKVAIEIVMLIVALGYLGWFTYERYRLKIKHVREWEGKTPE